MIVEFVANNWQTLVDVVVLLFIVYVVAMIASFW